MTVFGIIVRVVIIISALANFYVKVSSWWAIDITSLLFVTVIIIISALAKVFIKSRSRWTVNNFTFSVIIISALAKVFIKSRSRWTVNNFTFSVIIISALANYLVKVSTWGTRGNITEFLEAIAKLLVKIESIHACNITTTPFLAHAILVVSPHPFPAIEIGTFRFRASTRLVSTDPACRAFITNDLHAFTCGVVQHFPLPRAL